ncbi:MAG: hypothetical protein AAB879_02350 [Patescibacteria group bacterium]
MQNVVIERWNVLTFEQKLSVGILSVCGILAIGLSAYRIQHIVKEPFLVEKTKALAFRQSLTPSDAETEARLKRTDTDGDGLSDWDEINVYRMNPNLKDTCGDGLTDNVRVLTGRNLSCVGKGANVPGEIDVTAVENTASSLYGKLPEGLSPDTVYSQMVQAAAEAQAHAGVAATGTRTVTLPRNADVIRAALRGKVDNAKLDAISNADLLKLYDQAIEAERRATSGTSP